ncbi:MAG: DUF4179 domain-containing protein [Clostridia bacterium]
MDECKTRLQDQWEQLMPEVPAVFDLAMRRTLEEIVSGEQARRNWTHKRRTLVYILIAALLLTTVAMAAALRLNVFDVMLGITPAGGERLLQHNLAKASFDEVDVEIKEAAYDGISLYILYSVRDRNADAPLGVYDPNCGYRLVSEEMPAMQRDKVGWWVDHIWIDGRAIDMPNMSGNMMIGSDMPGELLFYQLYRLDQEDVYLQGKTEIAMPIGKRQSLDSLQKNADGTLALPKQGMVSFTLDASVREGVRVETPTETTTLADMSVRVTSVAYTPIRLYIELETHVRQEAIDALGKGILDEQGNVIMPYSAMDVVGEWALRVALVDGDGTVVFDGTEDYANGCQGYGDTQSWFQFPYTEAYPETMYLAPLTDGVADMTRAVRIR